MTSALFVISAADRWTLNDGSTHPTGFWAEELVEPHRAFEAAGWELTIATPAGVVPTVDGASLTPRAAGGPGRVAELSDYLTSIADELEHPLSLDDVEGAEFDVVFYPGGHGLLEDLAGNATSGRLLTEALDGGHLLALIGHGPAALLAARRDDGDWPFAGYRLTGFTDAEELIGGLAGKALWLAQGRLAELGADFAAGAPFEQYLESDRGLLTGQNPASSGALATAVLAAVAEKTAVAEQTAAGRAAAPGR